MANKVIAVKLSNGAGDEVAWLAEEGHLCGYSLRATYETTDQAEQAATEAENRHNLYADVILGES